MKDPIGNEINYIKESIESKESIPMIHEAKAPLAKIVHSSYAREQPTYVSFEQLIKYHDRTPQIGIAVSSFSEMITGTEMTIKTKSEEAQKFLDKWIRETNFYDKFESVVTTTLICGNSIIEKLDENSTQDIAEVDMATIIAKKRNDIGELQWYEHRTANGQTDHLGEGKLGKFIEFNLTSYSRQAWGKSLFYSLAIPRTIGNRTTPPLIEIMWGIEDAMSAIILNNAYPITTITYNGANDAYLKKEAVRWQQYKPGDKRVQKIKPEIEFFETQGNSKYTDYVEHLEKVFELGTKFPHDILTGDFTSRAASDTTDGMVQKQVRGYQRYLCNKLTQELFNPLLGQNGFDPEVEELEIGFTSQNIIDLEVDKVLAIRNSGGMSMGEFRNWLRVNTGMELPDDDEVEQEQQDKKDSEEKQLNGKIDKIKKEFFTDRFKESAIIKKCVMCKEGQHAFCSGKGCQCK